MAEFLVGAWECQSESLYTRSFSVHGYYDNDTEFIQANRRGIMRVCIAQR